LTNFLPKWQHECIESEDNIGGRLKIFCSLGNGFSTKGRIAHPQRSTPKKAIAILNWYKIQLTKHQKRSHSTIYKDYLIISGNEIFDDQVFGNKIL